jgi:dipeptidyl aminopeptidase/acylaminoacyl peptidase
MTNHLRRCLSRVMRLAAGLTVVLGASVARAQAPPCIPTLVRCQLSAGLPAGDVQSVQSSPDGTRAVFVREGTDNVDRLYSAPTDGSELAVPLTAPGATGSVGSVTISPDSQRVVYVAAAIPSGERALFSVPIAGPATANVRLASSVASQRAPIITPDSQKVVYAPAALDRLRAVPIEGPAQAGVRLTAPFESGDLLGDFASSANSKSLVYTAGGVLFRVPLTLSSPNPPTATLSAEGFVREFALAPNNGRVVYLADLPDNGHELFSVTLGGAARVRINTPLPPGWVVTAPTEGGAPARISPDGTRVIYEIIDAASPGQPQKQLLSVPIAGPGTSSARLDEPPTGAPDARVARYQITADNAWVVYTLFSPKGVFNLRRVPLAGPARESATLFLGSFDSDIVTLSPDGKAVVWKTLEQLFGIPIADPGESAHIDGDEDPSPPFLVNATSTRVVYRADTASGGGLFTTAIDGSGPRCNVIRSAPDIVDTPVLTGDGRHVLYALGAARRELFSSRVLPLDLAVCE